MKKQIMFALASSWFAAGASATVIRGGNVFLAPDSTFGPSSYAITVNQTISGDYTSMWFSKVDSKIRKTSTLAAVSWNVDEEADYYLVPLGVEFSKATISSGAFTPLFTTDNPASITVPLTGNFYLGINTGTGFSASGPGRDVFGWVQISSTATGLSILDSAMAYGESGIYIGTTTPVPEPSSFNLSLLSVGVLGAITASRKASKRL